VEWQPWDELSHPDPSLEVASIAHPDPSLEVASIAFKIKTGETQ